MSVHERTSVPADSADPADIQPSDFVAPHVTPPRVGGDITGATYTFAAADAGRLSRFNSASAQAATIPTNAAEPYPIGTELPILQWGAGAVTVAGDVGVTVEPSGDLVLSQFVGRVAHKVGTDEWFLW